MSQRNPMNDRYTREDLGKTRKSAASAKPATKAAASVRIEGDRKKQPKQSGIKGWLQNKTEKSAQQKADEKRANATTSSGMFEPDTPEYKKWRKTWWFVLILALIFTVLSFVIQGFIPAEQMQLSYTLLGMGYILLFVAIWIDIFKVRKLRKEFVKQMADSNSKATKRARKEMEAREAAAQAAAEAKREARREKLPSFLGGKKKNAEAQGEADSDAADETADDSAKAANDKK